MQILLILLAVSLILVLLKALFLGLIALAAGVVGWRLWQVGHKGFAVAVALGAIWYLPKIGVPLVILLSLGYILTAVFRRLGWQRA